MFSHEPSDYVCPFCNNFDGIEDDYTTRQDIVYQNKHVVAKVSPKWWKNNHGHVLVIPRAHYENIYDIPDEILAEVYSVVKKVAVAIRTTYEGCEGTSTRQHNEPAGNQDVWHLHVHVFPRYPSDNLYLNHEEKEFVSAAERLPYAEKLQHYFATH